MITWQVRASDTMPFKEKGCRKTSLFMIAIVAMGMSLVTNLAAMPTKIPIPVFALSLLMDLVIIGIAMAHGFDITSTYI